MHLKNETRTCMFFIIYPNTVDLGTLFCIYGATLMCSLFIFGSVSSRNMSSLPCEHRSLSLTLPLTPGRQDRYICYIYITNTFICKKLIHILNLVTFRSRTFWLRPEQISAKNGRTVSSISRNVRPLSSKQSKVTTNVVVKPIRRFSTRILFRFISQVLSILIWYGLIRFGSNPVSNPMHI